MAGSCLDSAPWALISLPGKGCVGHQVRSRSVCLPWPQSQDSDHGTANLNWVSSTSRWWQGCQQSQKSSRSGGHWGPGKPGRNQTLKGTPVQQMPSHRAHLPSWACAVSQGHAGLGPEPSATGHFPGEHKRDRQSRVGTRLGVQGGWLSGEAPGHSCSPHSDCTGTPTHQPNRLAVVRAMEKVGPPQGLTSLHAFFPWQVYKHKGSHWLHHPVGDSGTLTAFPSVPAHTAPWLLPGSSLGCFFWALF